MVGWLLLGLVAVAAAEDNRQGEASALAEEAEGARVAERCRSCHAFEPSGRRTWGPNLFGIVGRPMGAAPDYRYGSYLRARYEAGAVWDEASLRRWLVDSRELAKAAGGRTKMPSQHTPDEELSSLIAFLRTLR